MWAAAEHNHWYLPGQFHSEALAAAEAWYSTINYCDPVLAKYETDLDDMASRLTARTKAIVLCSPHNPAGTIIRRAPLTAFLDAHTFDTRRVMKCCLAHLLPTGHVVPFCAYNTLYRDGHVPLPPLADAARRPLTLVAR